MLASVLGTLAVVVPCTAVLFLLARWNMRLAEGTYREAVAHMDRETAAALVRVSALGEQVSEGMPPVPIQGPMLVVTFRLTQNQDTRELAANCFRLCADLNRYERTLGGQGLTLVRSEPLPGEPNAVRVELAPVQPVGARERLKQLASAVTGSAAAGRPCDPVVIVPSIFVGQQPAAFDTLTAAVTNGVVA